MRYKRSRAKGATFFFTVVTYNRRPILCEECNIALLREAFEVVIFRHSFRFDAFVLLPDHLNCIWTLPENDNDFSTRWRQIKSYFSRHCRIEFKNDQTIGHKNSGEQQFGSIAIGNIRSDDLDFIRHVEYIHYNPVKHGLVKSPIAWPHTTFHRYVKQGIYHNDWGAGRDIVFDHQIGNELK